MQQLDQQIAAADIRLAIAEQELENHDLQKTEGSRRVPPVSKYTNHELYGWMVGQISGLYFQRYQLAYDVAKRAERAFRYELGLHDSNFIQFGYWDSLKKGLLAASGCTTTSSAWRWPTSTRTAASTRSPSTSRSTRSTRLAC